MGEVGIDELAEETFQALYEVRVYTKSSTEKLEEFQRDVPFALPVGSTVAEHVHRDLVRGLKYAVLWGQSGKFRGKHISRDTGLATGTSSNCTPESL